MNPALQLNERLWRSTGDICHFVYVPSRKIFWHSSKTEEVTLTIDTYLLLAAFSACLTDYTSVPVCYRPTANECTLQTNVSLEIPYFSKRTGSHLSPPSGGDRFIKIVLARHTELGFEGDWDSSKPSFFEPTSFYTNIVADYTCYKLCPRNRKHFAS